ncbi:MAG: hypothetical protein A2X94_14320 [Bdellovibrionales bacterium GWB1_55_8]|nr:MAG: hypothetical protein A2X94_14320 [Bdellovibrionales bacterium GWB1_55_8]
MIWKPKERQLTREEAIALARKELKPLWFGTTPLLAGVRAGAKFAAHPLDQKLLERNWILTFVDATSFGGHEALESLSLWCQRYAQLGLEFLLVLRFPHPEAFRAFAVQASFEKELEAGMKIAIDHNGALCAAFGCNPTDSAKSVILVSGKAYAETQGPDWPRETETILQKLLREKDPGLPLLPITNRKIKTVQTVSSVDFGTSANSLNFRLEPQATVDTLSTLAPGQVLATGEWVREADKISTSDPAARILVNCPSPEFALVAQPVERLQERPRVAIQINGLPAFEEYFGPQMTLDEEGFTRFTIGAAWFFRPMKALPPNQRAIILSFPDSKAVKCVLFSIRFGQ